MRLYCSRGPLNCFVQRLCPRPLVNANYDNVTWPGVYEEVCSRKTLRRLRGLFSADALLSSVCTMNLMRLFEMTGVLRLTNII